MKAKESTGGFNTYDYVCEGCGTAGELNVPEDQKLPFGCPGGCGATYVQWKENGESRLKCVVCPIFRR